jgi:cysteinyl-tRNA synthetase
MKENKKSGRVAEGDIEDPTDPFQIAEFYTRAFLDDARKLNYKIASEPDRIPRATDHIGNMITMIEQLIDRGHAYVAADGVVYFSVETFPAYGQLSGNTLENLQSGAGGRILDKDQANKRHPADFLLWKPDRHHIMKWDSPWGTGYPGWHIECSVMARQLLNADVIDIHTGGEDLIFPHHECEIAQSCGVSGRSTFANYWIHAHFLFVENEKMSKSKGNFYTARDAFEGRIIDGKQIPPAVLRFELIKAHYRKNMNFTLKGLQDSASTVLKMIEFQRSLLEKTGGDADEVELDHPLLGRFADALANDLNIADALSIVIPWVRSGGGNATPREALGVWNKINSVLAIEDYGELDAQNQSGFEEVEVWLQEMNAARLRKDYSTSDMYRKKIEDAGYKVNQTKDGASIQKQLV